MYGEGWYIDETGARIRPCKFVRSSFPRNYLCNKDPILQQAAFWTRDLWDEVGPLNESLYWVFDWEWFIRAYEIANFRYIPQFLANYRVHPQAKTRSTDVKRRMEHAWITKTYGSWWHPNYLVQQTRIHSYRAEQITARWPRWLASLVTVPVSLVRQAAEWVFYGMYTT